MKPVWLLDVDGVINCSRPGWHTRPTARSIWARGDVHRIRWAPQLVDRITTVHQEGLAEIRWCTTWCGIPELGRMLGLPDFDDALTGVVTDTTKRLAALAVLQVERRPLVWTDDRAIPVTGLLGTARVVRGDDLLMIKPRATRGLRPEHLDSITEFCERHKITDFCERIFDRPDE